MKKSLALVLLKIFGLTIAVAIFSNSCAGPPMMPDNIQQKTWQSDVRLCTGGKKGNYYQSGIMIQDMAKGKQVRVDVIATQGSLDNLERMHQDKCDGAIVQADSLIYWQKNRPDEHLFIKRVDVLYREVSHLVCHKDSGIKNVYNLQKDPLDYRVIVGGKKAGNALTLDTWAIEDRGYAQIQKLYRQGSMAINIADDGEEAQCIFYVSGLRSPFLIQMERFAENLVLLPISDNDFNDYRYDGEKVYEFVTIPKNIYPKLQKSKIETLAVKAILIMSKYWEKRTDPAIQQKYLESVRSAKGSIRTAVKDTIFDAQ